MIKAQKLFALRQAAAPQLDLYIKNSGDELVKWAEKNGFAPQVKNESLVYKFEAFSQEFEFIVFIDSAVRSAAVWRILNEIKFIKDFKNPLQFVPFSYTMGVIDWYNQEADKANAKMDRQEAIVDELRAKRAQLKALTAEIDALSAEFETLQNY